MKKEIEFPDCWEELTQKDWEYLLKLLFKLQMQKGVTLQDIKRAWCSAALSSRGVRSSDKIEYYILVNDVAGTIDWMFDVQADGLVVGLNFDSTQNLLPKWNKYVGPASHGADLSFGEFRTCISIFNQYNTEKDESLLSLLCGILYRKPAQKGSGRLREAFNKDYLSLYQRRVANMPTHLKFGVYLWFASFCKYLVEGDFIVDGSQVCFSKIFGSDDSSESDEMSLGMNSILFTLAESGIFGDVEQTDNTSLMRTLLKLVYDQQKSEATLKEMQR